MCLATDHLRATAHLELRNEYLPTQATQGDPSTTPHSKHSRTHCCTVKSLGWLLPTSGPQQLYDDSKTPTLLWSTRFPFNLPNCRRCSCELFTHLFDFNNIKNCCQEHVLQKKQNPGPLSLQWRSSSHALLSVSPALLTVFQRD